jgi:rubrerythrin
MTDKERNDAANNLKLIRKQYNRYAITHAIDLAVELLQRPHGTWTEEFDESANPFFQRRWRCSACNDYNYYGRPDFCPCCGAEMRPKEGDADGTN